MLGGGPNTEDPREDIETTGQDWEEVPVDYGDLEVGEVDEAIRVLEEADYQANAEEEQCDHAIDTRARVDQERFQTEQEADRYAEYSIVWKSV